MSIHFKPIIVSIVLLFTTIPSNAQKQTYNSENEIIEFMNYVRDSVLKIDSWTERGGFERIKNATLYTLPAYKYLWTDSLSNIFSPKDINKIMKGIRDSSTYIFSKKMLNAQKRQYLTVGNLYYKLKTLKYKIDEYLEDNQFYLNIFCLNEIAIDTKLKNHQYYYVVADDIKMYNSTVKELKEKLTKIINENDYAFSKPIFLNNYKYCILVYSYKGRGYIKMYIKRKGNWKYNYTIVDHFLTTGLPYY